jgi:hypothetical protein
MKTLTEQQARLCSSLLSRALMDTQELLATGKDASQPLLEESPSCFLCLPITDKPKEGHRHEKGSFVCF